MRKIRKVFLCLIITAYGFNATCQANIWEAFEKAIYLCVNGYNAYSSYSSYKNTKLSFKKIDELSFKVDELSLKIDALTNKTWRAAAVDFGTSLIVGTVLKFAADGLKSLVNTSLQKTMQTDSSDENTAPSDLQ
jgi:hypothetical protein